jgi:hypothetical protein
MAENAAKLLVVQRPILNQLLLSFEHAEPFEHGSAYHKVDVNKTIISTNCRLLKTSPNGHRNNKPVAYPACMSVGTREAVSYATSKSWARMFKMG